ncbi:hypothetical protein [Aliarcobacter butzleri]|uniref:hypothetical protein n=1 Tax=Aliarcobacter butzleri TaxID=28197 RepID=UPI0021B26CDB|nr:hypothetical protein [Aliarcobacter butzleri]MCT7595523.1 hypothetical protein [Aliarcobacter butzleri]MCT7600071.1 hypothetical protein [Aliarcobacter butzleri]
MSNRSAEASIKGYNYQFLHTIKDILESRLDTSVYTVEGIEDLDIEKDGEKDLIQYKYHEEQSFTNSKVAKPIALMFKYFKDNQQKQVNYKLFIYLNDDNLPDKTVEKITDILKIKEARKILSTTDIELTLAEIDSLSTIIDNFTSKFEWKLTKKYNDLENEIVNNFETAIGITSEESKIIYLSNAIKIINDLAINSSEQERKILKRDFIAKLNSCKDIAYSSYILRTKNFNALKTLYKNRKNALNVKKNSSDFVIQINNIQRNNLNQLIIELSKKFCYKGNKSDFRPLIFIVNCTNEQYQEFKKSLYISLVSGSEDIKINDGYEDYHFNKIIFKQNPLVTKNKGSSKYEDVSYSFKLLHQQKYDENVSEITFSNPSLFILDNSETTLCTLSSKQFYLNNLENDQIIQIIGE